MNKNFELEILRDCVAKLGRNSYCGAWLAEILPSIESDIQADLVPTATIAATRIECERMVDDAKQRASELISAAESKAVRIEAECNATRGRLRRDLNAALDRME